MPSDETFASVPDSIKSEWKDFQQTLARLNARVYRMIQEKLEEKEGNANRAFLVRRAIYSPHIAKIEKVLPPKDAAQFLAYHILVDSSPDHKDAPKLDFPGEYSAKKFLEEIVAKGIPGIRPAGRRRKERPNPSAG